MIRSQNYQIYDLIEGTERRRVESGVVRERGKKRGGEEITFARSIGEKRWIKLLVYIFIYVFK